MPTSDIGAVPSIMHEIVRLNPEGVIELGVGFGKYGALCREFLDAAHGRIKPDTWAHYLSGVEAFSDYRNPLWSMYDEVLHQDFTKTYTDTEGWPLVLMIDSLEHVEKPLAHEILSTLLQNNAHVIISVPLGLCPQGTVFGNPFETHRSTWLHEDEFAKYNPTVLYKGICLSLSMKGAYVNNK